MIVVKTRVFLQQRLGVISASRREKIQQKRGLGYDPALLTPDVQRDVGAIHACLKRVNRVSRQRSTLEIFCYRWRNVPPAIIVRVRLHLLKKEHRMVIQSQQQLMSLLQESKEPNGVVVNLLKDMSEKEVSLQKDIDLLGI